MSYVEGNFEDSFERMYWDVDFDNRESATGISGLHLKLIGKNKKDLNEDLPPEIVMNMKDDELIDYLTTGKEWPRKDAEAYVKMFTPKHDGTKSFKDLEAGDVIEFLDGKLEGKWRVLLLRPTIGGLTIRIETLEH